MRPKSVFVPWETSKITGLASRAKDLPLFDDIDLVRRFVVGNKKLSRRRIDYGESFDEKDVDEFMAQRRSR